MLVDESTLRWSKIIFTFSSIFQMSWKIRLLPSLDECEMQCRLNLCHTVANIPFLENSLDPSHFPF